MKGVIFMQMTLYDLRKNVFKFSQEDMAQKLKISTKAYSEKERGIYPFNQDEMFAISKLFNRPIDSIFLPRCHRNGDKSNFKSEKGVRHG